MRHRIYVMFEYEEPQGGSQLGLVPFMQQIQSGLQYGAQDLRAFRSRIVRAETTETDNPPPKGLGDL